MDRDIIIEDITHEMDEDYLSLSLDPAEAALLAEEANEAASYYEGLTYEDYEANPYDGTYSEC